VQIDKHFYIGTSGIVVPIPKSEYPEEFRSKSRLAYYASLFNTLEINSSFYKDPKPSTIAKWATEVSDDFRFTFKCPKAISHAKHLQFNPADVYGFIMLINEIGNKKGCVLIQLPPSLSIDYYNQLDNLLAIMRNNNKKWYVAVEFRHISWYIPEVAELLGSYEAAAVLHDLPKSPTPLTFVGNFFYLRLHGENGRYRGSYDDSTLTSYAELVKKWLANGKAGYCYFNNTMGAAFSNAVKLRDELLIQQ
jgi:uncharacterized protein YecE (DUF72 family)